MRPPPIYTRTATLFPYTTLFRSGVGAGIGQRRGAGQDPDLRAARSSGMTPWRAPQGGVGPRRNEIMGFYGGRAEKRRCDKGLTTPINPGPAWGANRFSCGFVGVAHDGGSGTATVALLSPR